MISTLIKASAVLFGTLLGYFFPPFGFSALLGGIAGFVVTAFISAGFFITEKYGTAGTVFGGIAGFAISVWLSSELHLFLVTRVMPMLNQEGDSTLASLIAIAMVFGGTYYGAARGRWVTPTNVRAAIMTEKEFQRFKILDTSVIIDGRIADIVETGFIGGILMVPHFVLKELQLVADSSQSTKRNRGRRGLDILQKIKKMKNIQVVFPDTDFPEIPEVDLKLIELARQIGGKIVTNDFNLNKLAQLRGIDVLNINELANALKPVVLPGELMKVVLLKEGKEHGQGIGYLDDGTMIVVDNSSHLMGQTIELVVTSVLQTTAGKMIFGKTDDGKAGHLIGQHHD